MSIEQNVQVAREAIEAPLREDWDCLRVLYAEDAVLEGTPEPVHGSDAIVKLWQGCLYTEVPGTFSGQQGDEHKAAMFPSAVRARYVKIVVGSWNAHASMRAGVIEGSGATDSQHYEAGNHWRCACVE